MVSTRSLPEQIVQETGSEELFERLGQAAEHLLGVEAWAALDDVVGVQSGGNLQMTFAGLVVGRLIYVVPEAMRRIAGRKAATGPLFKPGGYP